MKNYSLSKQYTNILQEFEEDEAIINPYDILHKVEGFPEILIMTFTKSIVDKWAQMEGTKILTYSESANGLDPVYGMEYKNHQFAFTMAPVGAASCVGKLEDVCALGVKKVVVFGSCGVLDGEIADSHMIIPYEAMRDEGTSYHYAPPSDSIFMEEASVTILKTVMEDMGYPYVEGKTWTTDAFYRETRNKMLRRKGAGCIVVEMECAALIAAAKFRGIKFAQFLYAADNLDSTEWDRRGLSIDQGLSKSDRYMEIALECGIQL